MPLTVPDNVLLEIGRITVWQARIERQLVVLLEELAHVSKHCGTVIPTGFHRLAKEVERVLEQEFGAGHRYYVRFEAFKAAMTSLVNERNLAVHSLWSFGPTFDSSTAVRTVTEKSHKQVLPESTVVPIEELRGLVDRFESMDWEISDLRVRMCHYEVDTWHASAAD
jgi:hypothetical protein